MYRYDNYTDSFVRIDGEPNTGSTTVRVGVPLKGTAVTIKKVELTDECIEKIADAVVRKFAEDINVRSKDKPQTDCNKLINEVVKLDMSREDKFKVMELLERHCEKCKHYLFTDIDGHYCEHETYGQPCQYAPKDDPQTERSE